MTSRGLERALVDLAEGRPLAARERLKGLVHTYPEVRQLRQLLASRGWRTMPGASDSRPPPGPFAGTGCDDSSVCAVGCDEIRSRPEARAERLEPS